VEPFPDNCSWIRRSVAHNGYRSIEVVEAALGDTDATADLYVGPVSGWHTLNPELAGRSIGTTPVAVRRLDGLLAERGIDHVVIDQPPFLIGHWAASTGLFVRRYGTCMRNFVESDSVRGEFNCDNNWGQKPSAQLSLPPNVKFAVASQPWRKENDFLGKWYGFYNNGREVLLAIESIHGNEVTAVYAVGPGVLNGQKAEWVRRTGRIDGDDLIFKEKGRNTLLYRLRPDGRLAASWTSADGRTSMETTLRRTD
jgi:hypothetical protein